MNIEFTKFIKFIEDSNETPLYFLNMAIFNLATSLKFKNKEFQPHFKLAALLEEKSYLESLYGAEKKVL